MSLHQTSGRWKLGLTLALVTAAFWATLPVALKFTLEQVDAITLTWFRFAFAALVMGAWLGARRGLSGFSRLNRGDWWLLLLAAVMLIGNYVFYLLGLDHTTPANAQLLIQLAPLLMAMGGIFVFRERFAPAQWLGFALVVGGLLLFFGDQLQAAVANAHRYVIGALLIVLAAVVWALYALAQKQLLRRLSSQAILLFIYALAAASLLPFAHVGTLGALDGLHWAALLYCAVNTLGAYGAFAEALAHWEASRVSVVLALTPLLTVLTVSVVHGIDPALVAPERIAWSGWLGAALVVLGSATVSLAGRRRTPAAAAD